MVLVCFYDQRLDWLYAQILNLPVYSFISISAYPASITHHTSNLSAPCMRPLLSLQFSLDSLVEYPVNLKFFFIVITVYSVHNHFPQTDWVLSSLWRPGQVAGEGSVWLEHIVWFICDESQNRCHPCSPQCQSDRNECEDCRFSQHSCLPEESYSGHTLNHTLTAWRCSHTPISWPLNSCWGLIALLKGTSLGVMREEKPLLISFNELIPPVVPRSSVHWQI